MPTAPRELCGTTDEVRLSSIIVLLARRNLLPPGSIVDAGANLGYESCLYSEVARGRTIHAIDPMHLNVQWLERMAKQRPFIQPLLGALGSSAQTFYVPKEKSRRPSQQISIASDLAAGHRDHWGALNVRQATHKQSSELRQSFPVERLDTHFRTRWANETLGFAHFDAEGNELDVLHGGEETIRRDRPIFTVEVNVQRTPIYTTKLLSFITDRLGYDAFLVDEECGLPLDCRNLVCVPRARRQLHAKVTALLTDPNSTGAIVWGVDATNILQHGYPCCRQDAACCHTRLCCSHTTVPYPLARLPPEHRGPFRKGRGGKWDEIVSALH